MLTLASSALAARSAHVTRWGLWAYLAAVWSPLACWLAIQIGLHISTDGFNRRLDRADAESERQYQAALGYLKDAHRMFRDARRLYVAADRLTQSLVSATQEQDPVRREQLTRELGEEAKRLRAAVVQPPESMNGGAQDR